MYAHPNPRFSHRPYNLGRVPDTRWRRDRDSNPGYGCPHSSFRDYPVRPLRHLSAARIFAGKLNIAAQSQVDLGARRLAEGRRFAKPLPTASTGLLPADWQIDLWTRIFWRLFRTCESLY